MKILLVEDEKDLSNALVRILLANKYNVDTAYDGLQGLELTHNNTYDLIIIDGPWGSPNYSRSDIIDVIKNNLLSDEFIILMDDSDRLGEQQTLVELKELLSQKAIEYSEGIYSGEKSTSIICSKKYNFLISL